MIAAPPGQQTASVTFPISRLAVTPGDIDGTGAPQVEPGSYQVQVGDSTVDFTIHWSYGAARALRGDAAEGSAVAGAGRLVT